MLIRATHVIPVTAPAIMEGAVRLEGNQIVAVGAEADLPPEAGEEIIDLPNCVLLPGLINAHCHLDYTGFRASIDPPASFTRWIQDINALKRQFFESDFLYSIQRGFKLLMDSGTTTVANIETYPELLPQLKPPPIRTWWFLELIDVRQRSFDDASLLGTLSFFDDNPNWLGGFGLSPHAPYTSSIELYRAARRCCEQLGMPFTTHIAESVQENQMFANGSGELFDFMEGIGRDMSDCGHGSALSHLFEHGVLTEDCLAVHLNYLQDYDLDALAQTGVHVVHCPKCHTYFGHADFKAQALRQAGVNLCLGTDSLASNNTLDMRSEMREARKKMPFLSAQDVLEMSTINPARALHRAGKLGELQPGALADLVAFPLHKDDNDPVEAIVDSTAFPVLMVVNGEIKRRLV